MNEPIQQRKRRTPRVLPKSHPHQKPLHATTSTQVVAPTSTLLPHEQRRADLHKQYPAFPAGHIFVDSKNGVELFKNPQTGGWCARPETVLPYYMEAKR